MTFIGHAEDLIVKLNTAAREGRYSEDFWKELTGISVEELAEAWKADLAKKAGVE